VTPITQEYVMQKLAWDWQPASLQSAGQIKPQVAKEGVQLPNPRPELKPPMTMQAFKGFPQTMKKKEPQWASAARDNIEDSRTIAPNTTERGGGTWSGRGPR